ncbi:TetR/AcrR family transcriptional regulator [Streptomyces sp. NPDC005551]|uniref:TetR/AcrR family transcriptional regulator n=1 Tax=unclassified Streptomyces TaxID=2593676 RepID=UPI0033C07F99
MSTESARPLGRRERSKQRVRDSLYSSALALFVEQGYDRTTIDQIAERADVARGTFFNYFQRKEDLVTAWAESRTRRLEACMQKTQSEHDDVTVHLERCMATLAEFNETERDVTQTMLKAWVRAGRPLLEEPYAGKIFADIIDRGRQRGEVPLDIDPMRVGNVLRDAYLGLLYRWSRNAAGQRPLHMELREILRIVLTGVLSYAQSDGRGTPVPASTAESR